MNIKFISWMLGIVSVLQAPVAVSANPYIDTRKNKFEHSQVCKKDIDSENENTEHSVWKDIVLPGLIGGVAGTLIAGGVWYLVDKLSSDAGVGPVPGRRPVVLSNPDPIIMQDDTVLRGIPNIGAHCYLNTAIQSLYRNEGLRRAILDERLHGQYVQALKWFFEYLEDRREMTLAELDSNLRVLGHRNQSNCAANLIQNILNSVAGEFSSIKRLSAICDRENSREQVVRETGRRIYINDTAIQDCVQSCFNDYGIIIDGSCTQINIEVFRPSGLGDIRCVNPPEVTAADGTKFDLSSIVVNYSGWARRPGHYHLYTKENDGTWWNVDDRVVRQIGYNDAEEHIAEGFSTVVTYKRRG